MRLESLGQLAGGVAHDFNNLLAIISNYTAFIAEELDAAIAAGDRRWEPVRQDLAQVEKAAQRAIELTHQLLTFGRDEPLAPRSVDVNEVVREVAALVRRSLGARVRLRVRLRPDLGPAHADAGECAQVLLNLAVNARDAMPTGGTIAIETDRIMVDTSTIAPSSPPPGRYVRLRVSDTGDGMTPEVLEHIFEPYFTTRPEGTGLGLSVVHEIVEHSGGALSVESTPGLGTAVTVLLPATDEPPSTGRPVGVRRKRGRMAGRRVMVAAEDRAIRDVVRRILVREGCLVVAVADGESAIRSLAGMDLLLTDAILGDMLGREIVERTGPGTRALYMSGFARSVLVEQGALPPDATMLDKPFSDDSLLAAVEGVLLDIVDDAAG
ncbi:hypothetical protein GCM10009682_23100 [Luedemannella flava]|uniref:histidine kinase n=1 Tax=Luedemannella flava TaxID=349316 RepID=A0ABP4Y843_9ACTN